MTTKVNKYKKIMNEIITRLIHFAHKLIQEGGIIVKGIEVQVEILKKAEQFSFSNTYFGKGWERCMKPDGGYYGRTYINKFRSDTAE